MSFTTDPNNPKLGHGADKEPVPQNEVYLILSEEEIAKGYIRPLRTTYKHVGRLTELDGGKVLPLTPEQHQRYNIDRSDGYAAYLEYPKEKHPVVGRFLSQQEVDSIGKHIGGCGTVTTMALPFAQTYARNPKFYGQTYCCGCGMHLPVDEFVWVDQDGEVTNEKVGS